MRPALMSAICPRTASTAPRVANMATPPMPPTISITSSRQPQQPRPTQKKGERPFLASGGGAIEGTGEDGL